MTIRLSTALMQYAWNVGSVAQALTGGVMRVYTGSQPIAPEYAPTGVLLATLTRGGGAYTAETPAVGAVEFSGTGSTTISSLTVDGMELLPSSVTETDDFMLAQAVWNAINDASHRHDFIATWDGESSIVTLTTRPGCAARYTGATVTGSLSGDVTASYTNMAGGSAAVNGLRFGRSAEVTFDYSTYYPVASLLSPSDTVSGLAVAAGTAGWFRISGPFGDDFAADTNASRIRLDGSIGVSGENMTMSDLSISIGEEVSIGAFGLKSTSNAFIP